MLSYLHLKDNPRALRTFTSLDPSEFETLCPSFEVAWNAYMYDNHIKKKTRTRRFGGGRKARLDSIEDTLDIIRNNDIMGGKQHSQNQRLLRRGDTDALLPRSQTAPSGAARLDQCRPRRVCTTVDPL